MRTKLKTTNVGDKKTTVKKVEKVDESKKVVKKTTKKTKKITEIEGIKIFHVKKVLKNKVQNVDDLINRLENIKTKYSNRTNIDEAIIAVEKMIRSSFLSAPEFTIGYKYDAARNILFVAWGKNGRDMETCSKEPYSKKFGIKAVTDRMRKAIKKDYTSCGDVGGFLASNPIVPMCVTKHIDANLEKIKYSLRITSDNLNIVIG